MHVKPSVEPHHQHESDPSDHQPHHVIDHPEPEPEPTAGNFQIYSLTATVFVFIILM